MRIQIELRLLVLRSSNSYMKYAIVQIFYNKITILKFSFLLTKKWACIGREQNIPGTNRLSFMVMLENLALVSLVCVDVKKHYIPFLIFISEVVIFQNCRSKISHWRPSFGRSFQSTDFFLAWPTILWTEAARCDKQMHHQSLTAQITGVGDAINEGPKNTQRQ